MLIIWKFPNTIAGRTKCPRVPRVWDPGVVSVMQENSSFDALTNNIGSAAE